MYVKSLIQPTWSSPLRKGRRAGICRPSGVVSTRNSGPSRIAFCAAPVARSRTRMYCEPPCERLSAMRSGWLPSSVQVGEGAGQVVPTTLWT